MTGLQVNQSEMEGRNNLSISEFKTMLTLDTPVSNLEEEIDRRRGKRSKREFSSRILEAGLLLRDHENIIITTSVVVPSGEQVTNQSPQTAALVEVVKTTPTDEKNTTEVAVL